MACHDWLAAPVALASLPRNPSNRGCKPPLCPWPQRKAAQGAVGSLRLGTGTSSLYLAPCPLQTSSLSRPSVAHSSPAGKGGCRDSSGSCPGTPEGCSQLIGMAESSWAFPWRSNSLFFSPLLNDTAERASALWLGGKACNTPKPGSGQELLEVLLRAMAALCVVSWTPVPQPLCSKKRADQPGMKQGRAESQDRVAIAAAMPGSCCSGRASAGCRLWEGRAQQLSQPFIFSPDASSAGATQSFPWPLQELVHTYTSHAVCRWGSSACSSGGLCLVGLEHLSFFWSLSFSFSA